MRDESWSRVSFPRQPQEPLSCLGSMSRRLTDSQPQVVEVHGSKVRPGHAAAFVLTLGCLLAACGGGPTTAVVRGYAEPCVGPHRTQAQIAAIPVRVTISQHSDVIARQTARGSHLYRFVVTPGTYVVSRTQGAANMPAHPPCR